MHKKHSTLYITRLLHSTHVRLQSGQITLYTLPCRYLMAGLPAPVAEVLTPRVFAQTLPIKHTLHCVVCVMYTLYTMCSVCHVYTLCSV